MDEKSTRAKKQLKRSIKAVNNKTNQLHKQRVNRTAFREANINAEINKYDG